MGSRDRHVAGRRRRWRGPTMGGGGGEDNQRYYRGTQGRSAVERLSQFSREAGLRTGLKK